jgi:hypothetical protein
MAWILVMSCAPFGYRRVGLDVFAYREARAMLGRYKATTTTSAEALGKRVDAIEREMQALIGNVSNAVATSAGAEKQSQTTADRLRQLERTVRSLSQRPKK